MPIDPTIVVALVQASGGVIQKLLELLKLAGPRSSPDTEAREVILQAYEKVAGAVSPNSLRTLIVLQESGSFQTAKQIAEAAQKRASRQEPSGELFEPDITYRLRYLCLLGLIQAGAVDFALT